MAWAGEKDYDGRGAVADFHSRYALRGGEIDAGDYSLARFRSIVFDYYRRFGRHDLPWRHTADPYHIAVSEIMLQQTQVHRVIPKYTEFIARFPDLKSLASATLAEVLEAWSGLGYNRRAGYLH
ncbi:MAG: A/G-specific adenine glycosylase, partial [Spirochaetes bacterium]|nr:A/G-specific adenine glycosylase [Spirochaetota bacterium]